MTGHFAGYNGLFPQLPIFPKVISQGSPVCVLSLQEPPADHFCCWQAWERIFLNWPPSLELATGGTAMQKWWVCKGWKAQMIMFASPKLLRWTGYKFIPASVLLCSLPYWALGSTALLGHSPWQRRGFTSSLNCNRQRKGCWDKGCVLPALCVCSGFRFLNVLFLCSPFQVKIQILPSLPQMHPLWNLAQYLGFSGLIFRTTWTLGFCFFFSCDVSKIGRRRTFFKPAYAAKSILK